MWLGVVPDVLDVTYLCSIQAARMMAPAGPSFLLLKSASVIPVSMVTGSPSFPRKPPLPVNVILDNAPLSLLSWGLGVVLDVLDVTYLCCIQAARMMAPAGPSFLLLKSASVMSVSTVTGSPSLLRGPPFPVNVILDNAPLSLLS